MSPLVTLLAGMAAEEVAAGVLARVEDGAVVKAAAHFTRAEQLADAALYVAHLEVRVADVERLIRLRGNEW